LNKKIKSSLIPKFKLKLRETVVRALKNALREGINSVHLIRDTQHRKGDR
jgi:hypothetical protein